jgi:hypothetical protein
MGAQAGWGMSAFYDRFATGEGEGVAERVSHFTFRIFWGTVSTEQARFECTHSLFPSERTQKARQVGAIGPVHPPPPRMARASRALSKRLGQWPAGRIGQAENPCGHRLVQPLSKPCPPAAETDKPSVPSAGGVSDGSGKPSVPSVVAISECRQ